MRKIVKYLLLVWMLLFVKLLVTFFVNEIVIVNYHKEIYQLNLLSGLSFLNFPESYIAPYNYGNVLYQLGQYNEAILKYKNSLTKNPPQKRVCDIRINLSLAMLKNIQPSNANSLSKLIEARKNLYEDQCAHEFDDDGYSRKAEELEEQIRKLEKEVNKDNNHSQDDDKQEEKDETKDFSSLEEKLKENEKKANASRQEETILNEGFNNETYYSGKRW